MKALRALSAGLGVLCVSPGAHAHVTSTGLATITVEGNRVHYRLSLSLADLPQEPAALIARAAEGDAASAARLADALRAQIRVASGGEPCRPGRFQVQGSRLDDGRALLALELTCPKTAVRIEIEDALHLSFGEHYRTVASFLGPGGERAERVFAEGKRTASFDLQRPGSQGWFGFLALGAEHILTGYDHLMFVAALLVGSRGLWRILGIVTAFTLAHSVTLCLAALGIAVIPAAIVEPAIAASIVWVALENLYAPGADARRWAIGFLFGLVHGFGFASALSGIELTGWPFARALIGFNLGVELGQAAVIAAAAPLLVRLGQEGRAARLRQALSVFLALAGGVWFVVRVTAG